MSTDTRQAKEMSSAAEPPALGRVGLPAPSRSPTSPPPAPPTASTPPPAARPSASIAAITPHFLLGALANYSTVGANFSDGSRLGNEGGLFGLYGAWHQAGWHVYGVAAGGYSSYDIDRKTLAGAIAHAHPGSSNAISDFTGGYDLALTRTLTFTPELGLTYTHLGVDGYSEAGAGAFNLIVGQQDIDSLRTHLGGRLATTFQWNGVTFMPEIRAAWYHEFLDDSRGVSTSLPGAPTLGSFAVQTNDTERDFALVGIGLNTAFTGAGLPMAAFINYDVQAGQDNFIAHNIDAGFRVSFSEPFRSSAQPGKRFGAVGFLGWPGQLACPCGPAQRGHRRQPVNFRTASCSLERIRANPDNKLSGPPETRRTLFLTSRPGLILEDHEQKN